MLIRLEAALETSADYSNIKNIICNASILEQAIVELCPLAAHPMQDALNASKRPGDPCIRQPGNNMSLCRFLSLLIYIFGTEALLSPSI